MRHWNYRVVKHVIQPVMKNSIPSTIFGIHECFYDSKGKVWSVSEDPLPLVADSVDELKVELEHMSRAFKSPVLDYDKLPEAGALADEPEEELPELEDG